jgi:hypothetical protein
MNQAPISLAPMKLTGSWISHRARSRTLRCDARRGHNRKIDGKSMNMKRMRGRNHRPGGGGGTGGGGGGGGGTRHHATGSFPLNRNHVFDSNGPDIRVRGTAQQLFEKYLQLGRDATSGGDRVTAEGYFQHAEHYFRILNAMNQAAQQTQPPGAQGNQAGGQAQGNVGNRRSYQNGDDGGPGGGHGGLNEPEDNERAPGMGDQPEARAIPITAAPPEG